MRFETFTRRNWLLQLTHYFRLVSGANGQTVMQSQGYSRKIDMVNTIQSIKDRVGNAPVVEVDA